MAPTSGRSALRRFETEGGAWWRTSISDVSPGRIVIRGRRIEDLIREAGFVETLAWAVLGRRLGPVEVRLLEAAMVAGVDHGPRAPSIAAARMAVTCGVTFNSAVATGINLLGDYHGGAAEEAMRLFDRLASDAEADAAGDLAARAREAVREHRAAGRPVPGFGHQLHDRDPRRDPLLALVRSACQAGAVAGRHLRAALAVEEGLRAEVGRDLPMNVDGALAVVLCELGFPPEAAKGVFSLSRGVGIVAHALEELSQGARIKGPCPPDPALVRYEGPEPER
ncbi:MAG: citryl-CoA lyase [Clostridia bacterium]|nr:citryl-CoA lyase [Clostridia bacterium]